MSDSASPSVPSSEERAETHTGDWSLRDGDDQAPALASPRHGWGDVRERGSAFAIRALVFWMTVLGRGFGRLIVRVVAFYFWLFAGPANRASATFLRRLHGREPTVAEIQRQILRFAQTALDAFFLVAGKLHYFEVVSHGNEHLEELRDTKRGAILLGAHLGSFYAMRARGAGRRLPLYALVYQRNARTINEALERISPGQNATLLEMSEGVDFMLKVRELVEGGAIVAILADRVPLAGKGEHRTAVVDFLGAPARFPVGPYLLASMLKCPVYLAFGLYRDPDRYDLYCEPFAERIELPRKSREEALAGYAAKYAQRLEHYCRLAPDNWFNFYDFWER